MYQVDAVITSQLFTGLVCKVSVIMYMYIYIIFFHIIQVVKCHAVLVPKNIIKMYSLINKYFYYFKKILCENNDYDVYAQMNSRYKENILILFDVTTWHLNRNFSWNWYKSWCFDLKQYDPPARPKTKPMLTSINQL